MCMTIKINIRQTCPPSNILQLILLYMVNYFSVGGGGRWHVRPWIRYCPPGPLILPLFLRAYTKRLRLNAKYAVLICLVRCEIRVGVEVPKRPQRRTIICH